MWQWRKKLELRSYNQEVPKISGIHQKLWQRHGTKCPLSPQKKPTLPTDILTLYFWPPELQENKTPLDVLCHGSPRKRIQLSISVWFLVLWEESNLYLILRSVNFPSLFKDLLISQLSFGPPTGKISSLSARRVPSLSRVVSPPCHSHVSLCPQVSKMHFRLLALSFVLCIPLD